jgi:hypothetical protein
MPMLDSLLSPVRYTPGSNYLFICQCTTEIYTHVVRKGGFGVRSPVDEAF